MKANIKLNGTLDAITGIEIDLELENIVELEEAFKALRAWLKK